MVCAECRYLYVAKVSLPAWPKDVGTFMEASQAQDNEPRQALSSGTGSTC